MSFDNLKVTADGYDSEVVRTVKIPGGIEVTIQIADPEDDRGIGGGPHAHLEASTSYYAAGVPAEDRLAEKDSVVDKSAIAAAHKADKDVTTGAPTANAPGEHPVTPSKEADKSTEDSADDKAGAEKAQAEKPSAVSKPAARSTK